MTLGRPVKSEDGGEQRKRASSWKRESHVATSGVLGWHTGLWNQLAWSCQASAEISELLAPRVTWDPVNTCWRCARH